MTGVEFGLAIASKSSDRSKRYTALKASATGATGTGFSSLTVTPSNLSVSINRPDSGGSVTMDLETVPLSVASGPGRSVELKLKGALLEASGTMKLVVDSFFSVSGDFAIRYQTETLKQLKDSITSDVTVDLLTIGAENVTAFAGLNGGTANAVGLSLANAGFALAVATSQTDSTKTWIALTADAGSAGFVGPDSIKLSADSIKVNVNQPSTDDSLLNFKTEESGNQYRDEQNSQSYIRRYNGALTEASGDLQLNLNDFVQFSGKLALRKSTASLKLSNGSTVSTEVLAIGGTDINAFAGTNGGTPNAIGFNLTGLSFAFAAVTDVSDRTRTWTALDANATGVTFVGLPDVKISATSLNLSLNRPAATNGPVIDFASTKLTVRTGTSTTRDLDLSGTDGALLEASGTFTIDVAGFFNVSGSLAVRKSDFNLALHDGTKKLDGTTAVSLLTVAGTGLTAFAGMNASDATNKAGLNLTGVNFALAVATETADTKRKWTTLKAGVTSVAVTGITGVTMSSTNLAVQINRKASDSTLADYKTTQNTFTLAKGTNGGADTTIVLDTDGSKGELTEASGTIKIAVQSFFTVNGTFSVRSSHDTAVTLSNGTTIDADLLTIGGTNVSAFAGLNGGSATQTGISLGSTDFGLALITDRADAKRKFTSLKASAGLATFVGTDSISIKGTDLAVTINQGIAANTAAIPAASGNTQYRLIIADQTLGSVTFNKGTSSASANILAADADTQVAEKVKTALEDITGIGDGNVTVSGSRAAGFKIEFINTLAKTDVTGLTVSTNATLSGSLAAVQTATSVSAVSAVQSITLTRTPVVRPTVTTTVTEKTTGAAATAPVMSITISAAATASGTYKLTYNNKTETAAAGLKMRFLSTPTASRLPSVHLPMTQRPLSVSFQRLRSQPRSSM
ncbi:MAG UNVERIFIED_CONTAM: hypothetical protein LVR18_46840 [Planctomycetaceae bacterium]